jgi:DNA-directed RNA polymerase specialized sigma24 family protein
MIDWDRIVREQGPGVFATAWHILGHAEAAEDVVEEVFRRAHHVRCDPMRGWEALLGELAVGEALTQLARRKDVPFEDDAAGRLRQALLCLSHRQAAVFCLRYFDGLSFPQIARTLRLDAATVADALEKACERLESLVVEAATG